MPPPLHHPLQVLPELLSHTDTFYFAHTPPLIISEDINLKRYLSGRGLLFI